MTHLIRENTGRERRASEKERKRETRRKREEREELIRERPSEIMYTSKMMATVHAMDSRKKKAEGDVSLSGAPIRRDRGYIPGGRSDLDARESAIREAHDRAIILTIST